jgi:hypothetical protein
VRFSLLMADPIGRKRATNVIFVLDETGIQEMALSR